MEKWFYILMFSVLISTCLREILLKTWANAPAPSYPKTNTLISQSRKFEKIYKSNQPIKTQDSQLRNKLVVFKNERKRKKMKTNKILAILIILAFVISIAPLTQVKAQAAPTVKTYAVVDAIPNLTGVG